MSDLAPENIDMRQLPDSTDARRYVELASYVADLMEAERALELAQQSIQRNGKPDDTTDALLGFAAVSYWRAFADSAVRDSLSVQEVIPAEYLPIHQEVAAFRNRRVAHSHSHMSTTFAVLWLAPGGDVPPGVSAATVRQSLPHTVIGEWLALIDIIIERISALQTDVAARLTGQLAEMSIESLRALPGLPEITHVSAENFTAATSRGRYPTSVNIVYTVEPL